MEFSERAKGVAGVVAAVAFVGWGVTYVPVLSDVVPSMFTAPAPTVEFEMGDFSLNELETGTLPQDEMDDACDRIPFLLRPLASKPDSVRVVVFNEGHTQIGEATYSCQDGSLLDSSEF